MSFAAEVEGWVHEQEGLFEAIFKQSALDVVLTAQRMIPVDTGFARASVRASTREFPAINRAAKPPDGAGPKSIPFEDTEIVGTIGSLELGQTLYIGWTAAYAVALEYGHSKQAPNGFVRLAAQQWPDIVARNVDAVRPRG